jgi:glycosyltransferase involved in cell wall biosynthesis
MDGHRQNYCCVVSDWFLRNGFTVVLAAGRLQDGIPAVDSLIIRDLSNRAGVIILDLGDTVGSHLERSKWVRLLLDLEKRFTPEWTFLPTGDELRISLSGMGNGRTSQRTKRAAIFISANHLYPRYPRDLSIHSLLKRPVRWLRWLRDRYREHVLLRDYTIPDMGLDLLLHTNQDFQFLLGNGRFHYIPEIYRCWGFDMQTGQAEISKWQAAYQQFLAKHPGKEVVLFYGIRAARKGYDELLRLTLNVPDTLFVSCGRPSGDNRFDYDVDSMRSDLSAQGRIFEMDLPFLPHNDFEDFLFSTCNFITMPYRDWYGLSGVMHQAAKAAKPVLVPDTGYFSSMVTRSGIGMTYCHKDYADLSRRFEMMRRSYRKYIEPARRFALGFELEKVHSALADALMPLRNEIKCE